MNLRRCIHLTLVLAGLTAVLAVAADNPYQGIVNRNMFGLVPIPTGPPPDATPPVGLPKITPNGIMKIFGKVQVLFKAASPGQPPKEESYVMSEGDRQDDIAVQKIDEKSATITFNNHGTVQELALVEGKASSGVPPPAVGGVPGRPPLPVPHVGPGAPGNPVVGFGGRFGHVRGARGAEAGSDGAGGAASNVNDKGIYQPAAETAGGGLTPEQRIILIEAQREKYREEGNPIGNLLPSTPITGDVQGDGGDDGN